ncbi:MAG: CRISPR system precrRNA processing endoribonuclease RAMP protein Cas6 [Desulfovermiculus sp.]
MSWLEKFSLLPLDCRFKADDEFVLPAFKGGTFRGAFGYAFKKAVCVLPRNQECEQCILQSSCVYAYVFETPRQGNEQVMRKYKHLPHPFVLRPPLTSSRLIKPGDTLDVRLVLIGRAIEFLPYFVLVLQTLGELGLGRDKGRCSLEKVSAGAQEVYAQGDRSVRHVQPMTVRDLMPQTKAPRALTLELKTPLKLIQDHQIMRQEPHFQDIFRSLLRRIALLGQFHCDARPDCDFRSFIDQSREIDTQESDISWMNWTRYSTRQEAKMPGSGFVGRLTFQGDLQPYWPFLCLGRYVHVGKNTSFGLGCYDFE